MESSLIWEGRTLNGDDATPRCLGQRKMEIVKRSYQATGLEVIPSDRLQPLSARGRRFGYMSEKHCCRGSH